MAFVASPSPAFQFVAKKATARTTAVNIAAFQLHGGTSVRTGLLTMSPSARQRSLGGDVAFPCTMALLDANRRRPQRPYLRENVSVANLELSPETLTQLDSIAAPPGR